MKKNKLLIILFLIYFIVIGFTYNKGINDIENYKDYKMEETILAKGINYVGEDIKPGVYNIYNKTNEDIKINNYIIAPNTEVYNVILNKNMVIQQDNNLYFEPSDDKSIYYLGESNPGNYIVKEDNKYTFKLLNNKNIVNIFLNEEVYELDSSQSNITLDLKKGDRLRVNFSVYQEKEGLEVLKNG